MDSEKILKFAKKRVSKLASNGNRIPCYSHDDIEKVLDLHAGGLDKLKHSPQMLAALSDFLTLMILALEENERKNTKAVVKPVPVKAEDDPAH